jgi:hypothetical protein
MFFVKIKQTLKIAIEKLIQKLNQNIILNNSIFNLKINKKSRT